MKVGIVGCGATGLLMASFLSKVHDVTLYARREEQVEQLNRDGFIMETSSESELFYVQAKLIDVLSEEELVIVCVKQPDIPPLMEKFQDYPDMPILFLQNGMGHERLAARLPNPIIIGVNEHGVRLANKNHIAYGGSGKIIAGLLQGNQEVLMKISKALGSPDNPFIIAKDIWQIQKMKLLANAVINPITALFRVKNGQLIENKELQEFALEVCNEVAAVLEIDREVAWQQCLMIASHTSENRSSMLQDIEAGRRTEVDSILGFILEIGDRDLPVIAYLYKCIKTLESLQTQGDYN